MGFGNSRGQQAAEADEEAGDAGSGDHVVYSRGSHCSQMEGKDACGWRGKQESRFSVIAGSTD